MGQTLRQIGLGYPRIQQFFVVYHWNCMGTYGNHRSWWWTTMDNTSMRPGHPASSVDPVVLLRSNDMLGAFSRAASWWVLNQKKRRTYVAGFCRSDPTSSGWDQDPLHHLSSLHIQYPLILKPEVCKPEWPSVTKPFHHFLTKKTGFFFNCVYCALQFLDKFPQQLISST